MLLQATVYTIHEIVPLGGRGYGAELGTRIFVSSWRYFSKFLKTVL